MRSVFAHLWHTSQAEVSAALDRSYIHDGRQWLLQRDEDAILFIGFYLDGPIEDDAWASRFEALGGPPSVSVIADISGRHEGWPEAQSFIVKLLGEFEGVAEDDAALRLWSRQEIADDQRIDGKKFGHWRN